MVVLILWYSTCHAVGPGVSRMTTFGCSHLDGVPNCLLEWLFEVVHSVLLGWRFVCLFVFLFG